MDILRNIIGIFTSGIVRLLVTAGALALAYFFIVKPILHTAGDAIDSTNKTIQKSFESSGLNDIQSTMDDVNHQVEIQIRKSFHTAKHQGNPQKLIHCIQRANGNVGKIQHCTKRF
ncbi:MAG TPA: hypothetical protein VG518_10070 [Solirubrobacterales bacterium]|nr:hypothetical protein [Solirubrobacterales bacterium]